MPTTGALSCTPAMDPKKPASPNPTGSAAMSGYPAATAAEAVTNPIAGVTKAQLVKAAASVAQRRLRLLTSRIAQGNHFCPSAARPLWIGSTKSESSPRSKSEAVTEKSEEPRRAQENQTKNQKNRKKNQGERTSCSKTARQGRVMDDLSRVSIHWVGSLSGNLDCSGGRLSEGIPCGCRSGDWSPRGSRTPFGQRESAAGRKRRRRKTSPGRRSDRPGCRNHSERDGRSVGKVGKSKSGVCRGGRAYTI